jgi:hypothetical protein
MCLCNLNRHANCFQFDHSMTYNCHGFNYGDSDGYYFQNHPSCPTAVIYSCNECFVALNVNWLDISLDAILDYKLHSQMTFSCQLLLFKVSLIVTTICFILLFQQLLNNDLQFVENRHRFIILCILTRFILPCHLCSAIVRKLLYKIIQKILSISEYYYVTTVTSAMNYRDR